MNNSTFTRARTHLAALPGSGNLQSLYDAACILVHGFNLPLPQALPLLQEWNASQPLRLPEREVSLRLAYANRATMPTPRGYLLERVEEQQVPPPFEDAAPLPEPPAPANAATPAHDGFHAGTDEQIQRLADGGSFHRDGLERANRRGLLVFGVWYGFECYGVTDPSRRGLVVGRVDGLPFPAVPAMGLDERERVAVKGLQKDWPIGIIEAERYPSIALLEGAPDFLTAHHLVIPAPENHGVFSGRGVTCAPVAMLSRSEAIAPEALARFKGKRVRLFPHSDTDGAGLRRASRWQEQLLQAGAARVDLFDFSPYRQIDGQPVASLWDFVHRLHSDHQNYPYLERIMP